MTPAHRPGTTWPAFLHTFTGPREHMQKGKTAGNMPDYHRTAWRPCSALIMRLQYTGDRWRQSATPDRLQVLIRNSCRRRLFAGPVASQQARHTSRHMASYGRGDMGDLLPERKPPAGHESQPAGRQAITPPGDLPDRSTPGTLTGPDAGHVHRPGDLITGDTAGDRLPVMARLSDCMRHAAAGPAGDHKTAG